jgi:hypothetical protein
MTASRTASSIRACETPGSCCVDTTTASTRRGSPSTYSTVT